MRLQRLDSETAGHGSPADRFGFLGSIGFRLFKFFSPSTPCFLSSEASVQTLKIQQKYLRISETFL